jgi:hypothetical protein
VSGGPSGLAAFASLLLPEDGGALVPAGPGWAPPQELPADADVVLWGADAVDVGTGPSAGWRAAQREAALARLRVRPPHGWRAVRVHRLPPAAVRRDRLGRAVRTAIGGGAFVELHRRRAGVVPLPSRLDRALQAAGASGPTGGRGWHLGPGGSLLGFVTLAGGVTAVLRASAASSEGIERGAAGLRAVADLGVAPRLLDEGRAAGVDWSLEERLAGAPPATVTASLLGEVAERWRRLPAADGVATATEDDLRHLASALPATEGAVEALAARVARAAPPGVLRHGDLWAGNLLVGPRGALVAAIDWDHWHPAAVPGTDLLQLSATERRHRERRSLGAAFRTQPWLEPDLAGHLPADVDPEVIGLAWWATEVAGTLRRDPARADDARWVAGNVDAVIEHLR